MTDKHTGTCFCGAVSVEVTGAPEAMGYCHCRSCRSWSAGPVNAFTLWKPENVTVTKGAEHLGSFMKTEKSRRQFCTKCGGHLLTDHPTFGLTDTATMAAMVGGGGLVAVLGYLDDRYQVPARWRFLGHVLAAVWMLACLPPLPPLPVLGVDVPLGPAALVLGALYLVWMINLFNFMDGIDGIASVEAILVAAGGRWPGRWPIRRRLWRHP